MNQPYAMLVRVQALCEVFKVTQSAIVQTKSGLNGLNRPSFNRPLKTG